MASEPPRTNGGPVTIRELNGKIEALERLQQERDKRDDERHTSIREQVDSDRHNSERQATIALAAAQKALDKAEDALNAFKESTAKEIQSLRESRSAGSGRQEQVMEGRQQGQWLWGFVVGAAGIGFAIAMAIINQ